MSIQEYERISNMDEWEEGMNANLGGMIKSSHEYPEGSDEAKAFVLGWDEAEKGSKP